MAGSAGIGDRSELGLPFSDKKIIPQNSEQVGTDSSSVGITPVLRKRKTSEFRSEPFLGREKLSEFRSEPILGIEHHQNSVPNHFSEEKNHRNSVPNHFSEEKTPRNSVPNNFWLRITSEFRSEPFSEQKKLGKKTTFVSCFFKLQYFAEFRSVPFCSELRNGLFRNTRNHKE